MPPKTPIIRCYGDAITRGVRTTRGWPEHLWALLRERGLHAVVQNHGLPAPAKMRDVLMGLDGSCDIAILACPGYDAHGAGTPPREYEMLIRQALATLREMSDVTIGCTPSPVVAHPGIAQGFARHARRWGPKGLRAAQEAMSDLDISVSFHDIPPVFIGDGIHPTPEGYRWMAERVVRVLVPLFLR